VDHGRNRAAEWLRIALKAYPLIALSLFLFQYAWAYQFLVQFGISPEEAGLSQLKLLSRAALFGLVVAALYGALAAPFSLGLLALHYRSALSPRTDAPARMLPAWRVPQGERRRRWYGWAVVAFALIAILAARILAGGFEWAQVLFIVLSAGATFVLIRVRSYTAAAMGALCVAIVGALAWAAYIGGTRAGNHMAETGAIPSLSMAFGLDVQQVSPTWLNTSARPTGYAGEDLIFLGSDGSTLFLYDCARLTTRRVALAHVALDYSLLSVGDANEKRLRCP
jgi:hypothetical protein